MKSLKENIKDKIKIPEICVPLKCSLQRCRISGILWIWVWIGYEKLSLFFAIIVGTVVVGTVVVRTIIVGTVIVGTIIIGTIIVGTVIRGVVCAA